MNKRKKLPTRLVHFRKKTYLCIVIQIDRHIEILLLGNDCVIVPGLGGFMAHHVDARYDESDGMFLPPLRTLGFNPQLRLNDHLLVQSYIETYDISYPEALRRIEDEVSELKQHLDTNGQYEMNGLGILRLNDEGHYEFEPCEAGILTPDYYGLSTFEMIPLSILKKQEAAVTELTAPTLPVLSGGQQTGSAQADEPEIIADEEDENALVIRMSWVRNIVAVAAAVLAFLLIGTPISNSGIKVEQSSVVPAVVGIDTNLHAPKAAPVTENLDAATENADKTESTKADAKESSSTFTIVLASTTPEHMALDYIEYLKMGGFNEARIMHMNASNKVRVVCGSFHSLVEAHNYLKSLRKRGKDFEQSWVLEIK